MLNHSGTTGAWATGTWAITLETSTFAAVTQSRTNTQVNSWKRNGTELALSGGASSLSIPGTASITGSLTVNGNLIGKSDNTTEVGTYSTGAIKKIRMCDLRLGQSS